MDPIKIENKNFKEMKTLNNYNKSLSISGNYFGNKSKLNFSDNFKKDENQNQTKLKLISIKSINNMKINENSNSNNNNFKNLEGFNSNRAIINTNRNSSKNNITSSVFNDTKTVTKNNTKYSFSNQNQLKDVYNNSNAQDYFLELKKKKLLSEKELFDSKKELLKDKIKEMIKGDHYNFNNSNYTDETNQNYNISNEEIDHIATSVVLHDEIKQKHKEKINLQQFKNLHQQKQIYQPKSNFNSRFYYVMKGKIDQIKEQTINPYDPIFKKYIK